MYNKTKLPSFLIVVVLLLLAACASIGNPDGGRYDEEPPVIVRSEPADRSLNNADRKITLYFDEYIKLEKASEKVVVSPPQSEQPDIKAVGKRILVTLHDSLKPNTTYTVDFSDAIVDNNEGNPMGNYAYSFSTGDNIDTMEVSGYVLEASNLEPIKGILVGLHSDVSDTAFTHKSFERVSRTDSRGHFVIKGIAPGSYRAYALADANQNFMFDQKVEKIAFNHDIIVPKATPDIRPDTSWVDSIHYRSIKLVPYTHYTPDDIVLMAFKEEPTFQYLKRIVRDIPQRFTVVFGTHNDTLPTIRGLNFDESDAFIIERTQHNDSIVYWVKDSAIYNLDTLEIEMTYMHTDDSLGILVSKTDTLTLLSKLTRTQIEKDRKKRVEEWVKQQKKALKQNKGRLRKEEDYDAELPEPQLPDTLMFDHVTIDSAMVDSLNTLAMSDSIVQLPLDSLSALSDSLSSAISTAEPVDKNAEESHSVKKGKRHKDDDSEPEVDESMMPAETLKITSDVPEGLAPNRNPSFTFEEPLLSVDTAAIHLRLWNPTDSVWADAPFLIRADKENMKKLHLYAEWHPGDEYKLTVDSAAFVGLYGLATKSFENKIKVKSADDFSTLFVNVSGADTTFIVQLLSQSESLVGEMRLERGRAEFFYVDQGKYYLRGFFDRNGNGVWDTGSYADDLQAEEMHYYERPIELKNMWEITQDWRIGNVRRTAEKPSAIVKQKPDAQKTIKNRNAERERNK